MNMERLNVKSDVAEQIEKIATPALMFEGQVFTGINHSDAYEKCISIHPRANGRDAHFDNGFLTSRGRFVNRAEALEIAELAEQAKENAGHHIAGGLASEDLK